MIAVARQFVAAVTAVIMFLAAINCACRSAHAAPTTAQANARPCHAHRAARQPAPCHGGAPRDTSTCQHCQGSLAINGDLGKAIDATIHLLAAPTPLTATILAPTAIDPSTPLSFAPLTPAPTLLSLHCALNT